VAVLSVSAFSATAGNLDIGAVVQGLLQHNRFELTRRSELIHLPGAPLRTIPGYVLARIPNVASWFTKTWSGLRFAREQAWRRASGRYAEERLRVIAHLRGAGGGRVAFIFNWGRSTAPIVVVAATVCRLENLPTHPSVSEFISLDSSCSCENRAKALESADASQVPISA
jgi:hypothetical protein